MTQVKYNNARIIPAPLVSFDRNFIRQENGDIIGKNYSVTINGTIVAYKGSPDSNGEFWYLDDYPEDENLNEGPNAKSRLASILKKQESLKDLFDRNNIGKKFEIIPEDGVNSIHFYPVDISISFPEGQWYDTCPYTINIQTNNIAGIDSIDTNDAKIQSASESWAIEPLENPTAINFSDFKLNQFGYRVSHSLSAQGQVYYKNGIKQNPVEEAKKWISPKLGYSSISSGYISTLDAYNHILSENIDDTNGSYAISESWTFAKTNYTEEYNISTSTSEGLTRVSIDGTITGLEENLSNPIYNSNASGVIISNSGYEAAKSRFNDVKLLLHSIAQDQSGYILNPVPVSNTIGRNIGGKSISYNYEYDNRPCFYISGAQAETITVSYNYNSKRHAAIPVLGRLNGPVLQPLGTSEAKTKTLSIDFILTPRSGCSFNVLDFDFPLNLVSGIFNQLDPINNGASKSFYDPPQATWNPHTRAGSMVVTWTWE